MWLYFVLDDLWAHVAVSLGVYWPTDNELWVSLHVFLFCGSMKNRDVLTLLPPILMETSLTGDANKELWVSLYVILFCGSTEIWDLRALLIPILMQMSLTRSNFNIFRWV